MTATRYALIRIVSDDPEDEAQESMEMLAARIVEDRDDLEVSTVVGTLEQILAVVPEFRERDLRVLD